jgi:hypothetical protein
MLMATQGWKLQMDTMPRDPAERPIETEACLNHDMNSIKQSLREGNNQPFRKLEVGIFQQV